MSSSSVQFLSFNKSKAKENYTRIGRKNKTSYKEFVKVCKMSQPELKNHLHSWLEAKYAKGDVISGDGFLYARGDIPVLVTAHMDTVHDHKVKDFYEFVDKNNGNRHIISSPQGIGGDDRCGIYMIKEIVKSGLKPYVLFCEDEEIGRVGCEKFCKTKYIDELKDMLFLIELDRAHANDLVFYEDANIEFHDFCEQETDYLEGYGSFSDISSLSPACGVSSVNISCGYYNAHSTDEYVVIEEMESSIKTTIKLIEAGIKENKQYEYATARYSYGFGGYGSKTKSSLLYGNWYDNVYEEGYQDGYEAAQSESEEYRYYTFIDYDGNFYEGVGKNRQEAFGFMCESHPLIRFNDIIEWYEDRPDKVMETIEENEKEVEEETEELEGLEIDKTESEVDDVDDDIDKYLWEMLKEVSEAAM